MLIKGNNLLANQRKQVLDAFIYRWTKDNPHRERVWKNIDGKPTIDLQTDDQWLSERAFYFVKDGSRLMYNRHRAEPSFMADNE